MVQVTPAKKYRNTPVTVPGIAEIAVSHDQIPEGVLTLLQEFTDMFKTPSDLPPRREIDHRIPLILELNQ
jgi:hypothetical protein